MKMLYVFMCFLLMSSWCYAFRGAHDIVWKYATGELGYRYLNQALKKLPNSNYVILNKKAREKGFPSFFHLVVESAPYETEFYHPYCSPFVYAMTERHVTERKCVPWAIRYEIYDPANDRVLSELLSIASKQDKGPVIRALRAFGAKIPREEEEVVGGVSGIEKLLGWLKICKK